jgi:aspartate racemase
MSSDTNTAAQLPKQKQLIGVVGGLGPFAHVSFEQKLLNAAREILRAQADQAYPQWVVSSIPQTPDRTLALQGKGPSPASAMVESLKRLEAAAAVAGEYAVPLIFACIPCITSHAFLPEVRTRVSVPIIDMVQETARVIASRHPGVTVGILATSGTLQAGLFHKSLKACGLTPVSPLDMPNGEAVQRDSVMGAIYGPWRDGKHIGGGIKSAGPQPVHTKMLADAAALLVQKLGAKVVIAGCTEIPLAITEPTVAGVPVIDPVRILAEAAVTRAYGLHNEDGVMHG